MTTTANEIEIKAMISNLRRNVPKNVPVIDRATALAHVNVGLLARHQCRLGKLSQAWATPLPGPLAKAFLQDTIPVAGKIVYKLVPKYMEVLQALDSPLLKMIQHVIERSKDQTLEFKPQEAWDLCWVMTHPSSEVWKLLQSGGTAAIHEASSVEVGETWEASATSLVMLAVMEQVKRHIDTAVTYGIEAEKGNQLSFLVPASSPTTA